MVKKPNGTSKAEQFSHNMPTILLWKRGKISDQMLMMLYQFISPINPLPLQKKTCIDCEPAQSDFQTTSEIWWQLWIRSSHRSKNPDPRSILGRSRWKPWWFFAMFWSKNDIAKSLNWRSCLKHTESSNLYPKSPDLWNIPSGYLT